MDKSKRIGMILERDFPPDDRPEKEALSLIQAGYEVHLLCFTWQDRPLNEDYKDIKITRFKINRNVYKKLSAVYLVLPFYKMIWRRHIYKFIKDNKINIIHIHDLPMTDIALEMAEKYNCKVVCDQHEYWSNWIVNTAHYNNGIGKIVNKLSNWKRYEKKYLSKADLVVTVTDPLRKLYISDTGIPPEKIITIPNTPNRNIFKKENVKKEIIEKYKDNFILLYVGAIDVLRGLNVVINSLTKLEEVIPNIKFLLAGRISKNFNILEMAKKKKVSHLVEFVGWLEVEYIPSYIEAADICLFTPYYKHSEINNTIATKIYQYLAMYKPIITSYAKMMEDFVVNNGLGYAINPDDDGEFIEKVMELYSNYERKSAEIKKNSIKLINSQPIFWDQTIQPLIREYSKF
jgi:glycosyltransferase involved in cell wall biosynthesis